MRTESSIVSVMSPCTVCVELRNIYTNVALKYRIAVKDSRKRLSVYELNKMCDAKEAAGQNLQDHELTHGQSPTPFMVASADY